MWGNVLSQTVGSVSPEFTTHIHQEKIRLLRAQLPFVLIAVVFVATGMAIVKRLCELLDYPLQVHSTPSKGSVFCIGLPLGRAEAVLERRSGVVLPGMQAAQRLVLVIDDEVDILEGMREILLRWGFVVLVAESLQQAEQVLAAHGRGPDAILADLRLRDHHTGIEAIEALQTTYGAHVPGLILTGDTAPERLQIAGTAGYRVLYKPVKPARLRVALQQLLASRPDDPGLIQ